MRKYLYFRTVADEANDGVTGLKTNNPSSFLFPADNLTAIQPTDDGVLTLYFKPALAQGDNMLRDSVNLNVNEGDHYEVMTAITDAIANPARGHSDGFIVIADDVATTDSATTALNDLAVLPQYIHSSITSCGDITVQPTSVYGMHEYFETVDLPAADTADDAVLAALGIYIPAQATIVEASITAVELYSNDVGSVALEVHTAVDTGASAGTEIIGADEGISGSNNGCVPDANLDVSSNAILGDTIAGGTVISHESPLDRGTNASYFHLVAKEDMSTTDPTGTAKVAVYLKWYGPAAIAL